MYYSYYKLWKCHVINNQETFEVINQPIAIYRLLSELSPYNQNSPPCHCQLIIDIDCASCGTRNSVHGRARPFSPDNHENKFRGSVFDFRHRAPHQHSCHKNRSSKYAHEYHQQINDINKGAHICQLILSLWKKEKQYDCCSYVAQIQKSSMRKYIPEMKTLNQPPSNTIHKVK